VHKSSNVIRQILFILLGILSFGIYAGLEKKSSDCEEPCPNKNQHNIPKKVSPKPKKIVPEIDSKVMPGVKELKESIKLKILNEQSISGRIEKLKAMTTREIQNQENSSTEFANSPLKTYKMDNTMPPIPSKTNSSEFNRDLNDRLKIKE